MRTGTWKEQKKIKLLSAKDITANERHLNPRKSIWLYNEKAFAPKMLNGCGPKQRGRLRADAPHTSADPLAM